MACTDPCSCCHGACCTGSSCAEGVNCYDCEAEGGVWQGAGSTCTPNPCGQECVTDYDCPAQCVVRFDEISATEFNMSGVEGCTLISGRWRCEKAVDGVCRDGPFGPLTNSDALAYVSLIYAASDSNQQYSFFTQYQYCCEGVCQEEPCVQPNALPSGPGTELKKLLKTIGIEAKPGCKCNKRARTMDEKGCDWCAENLDLISAWLQEEADKRGLPYIPTAGKWIINLAIKRARRGIGQ